MTANNTLSKEVNNSSSFTTFTTSTNEGEIERLWCGCNAVCNCAHNLVDHGKNDDAEQGHCMIRGCRCDYFTPHIVKAPRRKKLWGGSW